jgi:Family of unknown function (DUF6263)
MKSHIEFVTAGVVALGLLFGPPVSALRQDVTLRYRWAKGDTLRYRITQQSTTTISGLPGGVPDMAIDQSTGQTLRGVAEDVASDGTTTLRQVVESAKMEMNSPMFTMAYDSANPGAGDNPMSAMLKDIFSAMIGESFTLVIAPTGEVQKAEGFAKVAEKMFKNVPQDPQVAGIMEGLKANLSDDAMKNMFMQTFAQFPNRPLKSGDTWNSQFTTYNPMLGALTTSVTSTLKALEGDGSNRVAKIVTSVTVKQDATKPAQANAMGFSMQMGDGTGEGEQVFDAGTGRLRGSTTRMTVPMTMSGTGPDGSTMSMKTSVKSTTTVELIQP